jgi:hypothetical protein
MKKMLKGVKPVFSAGSSSRSSSSCSQESMSQDLARPWSFMPPQHGVTKSSYNQAQAEVPTEDDDSITIWNTKGWKMFESLHVRELVHTHVYDVNLLKRVGLDIEVPTILHAIRWGKLYDEPLSGSRLLTLEFLMTLDLFVRHRKSNVCFHLFGRRY